MQMTEPLVKNNKSGKKAAAARIARTVGLIVLLAIFAALTVNSLLNVFVDGYYPTFGNYRLFAIVSDSMEPTIPTGDMIVGRVPTSAENVKEGDVITYEYRSNGSVTLITHRVTEVVAEANGSVRYVTQGDNAPRADSYRPRFEDVVGVYTGNRCGFFGYFFGFLQSTSGAIALIIIALIIAVTAITVRYVNLVTVWRKTAVSALKKGGTILSGVKDEDSDTVADVIGIVSKDPVDKTDLKRKDKKLNYFIRTGALPKRPYSDDIDENAPVVFDDKQKPNGAAEAAIGENNVPIAESPSTRDSAGGGSLSTAVDGGELVRETVETVRYDYTYTARLICLKPAAKEWYSRIKNELMSYERVRAFVGKRRETFSVGRKTVAALSVRGKTLCLQLALSPSAYDGSKYAVERSPSKSDATCRYRIKSERRAKYAVDLIADAMAGVAQKRSDYEPRDYYMPYEGIVSLMSKGLATRKIVRGEKTFRVTVVEEKR